LIKIGFENTVQYIYKNIFREHNIAKKWGKCNWTFFTEKNKKAVP
jgi:hypothetical protein